MVKVLTPGKIPEPKVPWWQQVVMACTYCGTRFVIQDGDQATVMQERCLNGMREVSIACPTCGRSVTGSPDNEAYIPGAEIDLPEPTFAPEEYEEKVSP